MNRLEVFAESQTAELWNGDDLLKTYSISTAANGLGCTPGSNCTPTGRLRVAHKIGNGFPIGSIFKARVPTGETWTSDIETNEDLILTRILWLEGIEEANANTLGRYIYLHGTNQENLLGTPVSHGCIRFSNKDIIEVFDLLSVGSEVEVI